MYVTIISAKKSDQKTVKTLKITSLGKSIDNKNSLLLFYTV